MGKKKYLPKHFRFDLQCLQCNGELQADAHGTMADMDAWIGAHFEEFGHYRYLLKLFKD